MNFSMKNNVSISESIFQAWVEKVDGDALEAAPLSDETIVENIIAKFTQSQDQEEDQEEQEEEKVPSAKKMYAALSVICAGL